MEPRSLVIIGGVAAGCKAAAKARRCDPRLRITLIEKGRYMSYGGCGMPYLIAGEIASAKDLMATPMGTVRTPEFFKNSLNVDVLIQHEALWIDRDTKNVTVRNLQTGKTFDVGYDKLILATGSVANRPEIPGADLKYVYSLSSLAEAEQILDGLTERRPRRAVCVGGGLVTLETASGFIRRGVETTVVAQSNQLLFRFDYEVAKRVEGELRAKGALVYTGERVEEFIGDGQGRLKAVRTDKRTLEADIALVAKGVRPNVKLAKEAGLELGVTGALKVDDRLRTSDPDIFAAGDCVETTHLVTGKKVYVPRGSTANKMGRVAAINATGGDEVFPGALGNVILKVCDIAVGKVGLSERETRDEGIEVETALVPTPDKAHFYPGSKQIIIKLVAEKATGRLLGAQAVGYGEVAKRLDVAATLITCRGSVDTLSKLDLSYAPPFSSALDAIITAANVLKNKLDGCVRGISPVEVKRKLDSGETLVLLDVRGDAEYAKERIPGSVLIPLPQLMSRVSEVPRDRQVVVICGIGLRAYNAALKLRALGFTDVAFLDGGLAAWPYEKQ